MTIPFLLFPSSFTTNGCALHNDRLGLMISFSVNVVSQNQWMECWSDFETFCGLVAMGLQFACKLANCVGGLILIVVRAQKVNVGLLSPYLITTLLCCSWKSVTSNISVHKSLITYRWTSVYLRPRSLRPKTQYSAISVLLHPCELMPRLGIVLTWAFWRLRGLCRSFHCHLRLSLCVSSWIN